MLITFVVFMIANMIAALVLLQRVCEEKFMEDGFQVKHIFVFTLFLPAVILVYLLIGIAYVIYYIYDKISWIFNIRLF